LQGYKTILSKTITHGKSRLVCFVKDDSTLRPLDIKLDNIEVVVVESNTLERIITINDRKVHKTSRLDLVFSKMDISVKLLDKLTSDHEVVLVKLKNKITHNQREKHYRRIWTSYTPDCLISKLTFCQVGNSVDDLALNITNSINKALDEICPIRVIRTSRLSDLLDQELEKLKKKRKRLLKDFNRTKNGHLVG